jgi:hypothetical protein
MARVCLNGAYVLRLVGRLGDTVDGRCPALMELPDGRNCCGIVLNPKKYIKESKYPAAVLSRNFAHLIGAGAGCDELLDNDSAEEEARLSEILERKKSDPEWSKKVEIALRVIHS